MIIADHYGEYDINKGRHGHIFELELALLLVRNNKEQILAFCVKYKTVSANPEFDLETASGKLIECKVTEADINKKKIINQKNVAKELKKEFWVYIKEGLSIDMKQWFEKNQINFQDNLKQHL